jgi:hypothetical protein
MAGNFKSDDSFLKKLVVGAAGVNTTIKRLKDLGFNPIELERGSTGFKIWKKIKIKRIRVPDILCLNTGLRFESRGKTKLEISMSHSLNDPKRAWDFGMRDDDMVTIVAFEQNENTPVDVKQISPVHFVTVRDMREAFKKEHITISKPKGFEEGSEIRVIWPSAFAHHKSQITNITQDKIKMEPVADIGRKQNVQLPRNKGKIILIPYVKENEYVEENQIIASVVPVALTISCPETVKETYFVEKLGSVNLSERYAAAKALRYRGYSSTAKKVIEDRMYDNEEDIYVKLEAAAALAVKGDIKAWEFLENRLYSPTMTVPLETQLETIIVSSELAAEKSESLLIDVLRDNTRDTELRAGAAWALGQFSTKKTAQALVDTFDSNDLDVKHEAARALLRIGDEQKKYLLSLIKSISTNKRDGISWVLARIGDFDPNTLLSEPDENLRKWISYILGYGKDLFNEAYIDKICQSDPKIYFAASVLWQILHSWIYNLSEY